MMKCELGDVKEVKGDTYVEFICQDTNDATKYNRALRGIIDRNGLNWKCSAEHPLGSAKPKVRCYYWGNVTKEFLEKVSLSSHTHWKLKEQINRGL